MVIFTMWSPREWHFMHGRKDGLRPCASKPIAKPKNPAPKASWADDKYKGQKAKSALSFRYWYEYGSVQCAPGEGAQLKSRAQWKNGRLRRPGPSSIPDLK